jgi:hypothetical protein
MQEEAARTVALLAATPPPVRPTPQARARIVLRVVLEATGARQPTLRVPTLLRQCRITQRRLLPTILEAAAVAADTIPAADHPREHTAPDTAANRLSYISSTRAAHSAARFFPATGFEGAQLQLRRPKLFISFQPEATLVAEVSAFGLFLLSLQPTAQDPIRSIKSLNNSQGCFARRGDMKTFAYANISYHGRDPSRQGRNISAHRFRVCYETPITDFGGGMRGGKSSAAGTEQS